MADELEFGCSVCGSTVDADNRCPVCDAARTHEAPTTPTSLEDAPTLGVKPYQHVPTSLEDAPTLGVRPVAPRSVPIEDASTIPGRPVPAPLGAPREGAPHRPVAPGARRPSPRTPASRPRPFGPLIELGIVLAIAALVLGATLYAIG